jgi:Predicted extracellular nuclease
MRCVFIFGFFLVVLTSKAVAQNNFRIMFYNVENLFDTKKDSLKDDDDFLPGGFMNWTPWKYWEKLRNITRVVTAVGEMQSPALVGLCEVENDSVLFDLTKRSPLRAQEYEFIISHSPDERGIDVALLYQRHQFKLLETDEYEVRFSKRTSRPTRNILHAVGEIISGDTIDVFVNHFPSRSDGQHETEPARIESAALLRSKADSLFSLRENANIVIMGDFNDNPGNKSLSQTLKARNTAHPRDSKELYNLFFHRMKERDFGTYKYQGKWEVLDQFIVSGNMLTEESGIRVKNGEAYVFKAEFLLEDDERYYGKKPYRTNLGPRYIGGFSDHLPIYMDLIIRE